MLRIAVRRKKPLSNTPHPHLPCLFTIKFIDDKLFGICMSIAKELQQR